MKKIIKSSWLNQVTALYFKWQELLHKIIKRPGWPLVRLNKFNYFVPCTFVSLWPLQIISNRLFWCLFRKENADEWNWPGETYLFTQMIRSLEFESHWHTPCWFIHWMPWEVVLLNDFFVDKCLLKKEGDGSTRWWDQQTLSQRPGKAAKINSI